MLQAYKRTPICTMEERIAVVETCEYVDEVVANAPLQVTAEYMERHRIRCANPAVAALLLMRLLLHLPLLLLPPAFCCCCCCSS